MQGGARADRYAIPQAAVIRAAYGEPRRDAVLFLSCPQCRLMMPAEGSQVGSAECPRCSLALQTAPSAADRSHPLTSENRPADSARAPAA